MLLRHEFDPSPIIAEGSWEGYILNDAMGEQGFGYDPLFCNADTGTAAATLAKATKNRLSHRGKAVATLVAKLKLGAVESAAAANVAEDSAIRSTTSSDE